MKQKSIFNLLVIFVILMLSLVWQSPQLSGKELLSDALIYEEAQTVYLGNLARRDNGVPPLRWNSQLSSASRWFSWDSVENRPEPYCGHQDTQGNWPDYRARAFGYLGSAGAENAFCGYVTPSQAIQGWLDSPGHRANLLAEGHREIGLGYYRRDSDGRGYVAQMFGADAIYPPVIINDEALHTTTSNVDLYIYDRSPGGGFAELDPATEMRVSNSHCLADTSWEPYVTEKTWTLDSGEGWRDVYVQTRDNFNRTVIVSDTIYLGNDVPTNELTLHQASTTKSDIQLYNLESGSWPMMQFSAGWAVDDTFGTFGLNWGDGERVNDATALGGTAFRLRPGAGESNAWVWTTEFVKDTPLVAYVRLKTNDNTSTGEVARFAVNGGGIEYGALSIKGTDFTAANQYQEFALPFTYHDDPDNMFLIMNFWRSGSVNIYVDAVYIFTAPQPVASSITWPVPGGNYRGQGVWVRYTDSAGNFSGIEQAQLADDVQGVTVQPTTLTFEAEEQSGLTEIQTLTVTSLGCGATDWQVSTGASWLLAQKQTGSITVQIDTTSLSVGTHQANVTVSTDSTTHNIPVTIEILPPPFVSTWMTERIADGKTFNSFTDRALAVDSQGHLHVVYGGERLYYALYDGNQWQYETIPTPLGSGSWASVAVDTADNPHISFYYSIAGHPYPDGNLLYAHKSGTDWEVITVDTTDDAGRRTSLTLDSNNQPHISYTRYDGTDTWLQYATLNNSVWQIEPIVATGSINRTSIAVDSLNQPHISYSDGNRYVANGAVKYAYKNGNIWQVSPIASCDPGCDYLSSIRVDSQNQPHIAYYSDLDAAVFHSVKDGATWQSSIVEDNVDHSYGLITNVSINLDDNDTPHISYIDFSYEPTASSFLRLAHLNNSAWITQTLDVFPWQVLGAYEVSVDTESNGKAHVAYIDNGHSQLKLASVDNNQNVVLDTVDENHSYWLNSLEAQNSDNVHLSYIQHGSYAPTYNLAIQHAIYNSGQWVLENIGQGNNQTSMIIDVQGLPHVVFTVTDFDAQSSTYTYTMKYGVWNSTSWIFTDVFQSNQSFGTPQIQLDSQEDPHIVYGSSPPIHAQRINSTWITNTIPISHKLHHFTIDSNDGYHGVYDDYGTNQSVYAQWSETTLVTNTIISPASHQIPFAIDASNTPHVLYFDGEWLYATWTGSEWIDEPFFSTLLSAPQIVMSPQGGGGYASIDLDFGNGNVPHIIYTNGSDAVTHFHKENGIWITDDLGFSSEIAMKPIIDVNDNGDPVVAFRGGTDSDIFFAWKNWESQVTQACGHFYVYDTAELIFTNNSLNENINLHFIPEKFTQGTVDTIFVFTLESTASQAMQSVNVGNYQLYLNYDELNLSPNINEHDLAIGYWDGNRWVMVDSTINPDTNQIGVTTNHFGTFALIENSTRQIFLPLVVK